jgi:predicted HD phosphohydrolase
VTILTIHDIERLLVGAARRPVSGGVSSAVALSQLDHALQTACVLRRQVPGDEELAVAGLVHDIGHLLPGVGDVDHAEAGAASVRASLGIRVARLVGLHVEAKRYLVGSDVAYKGQLAADSVASLDRQGGPMSAKERSVFRSSALAVDAIVLRRADESGKVDGPAGDGLGEWMARVRRLHQRVA